MLMSPRAVSVQSAADDGIIRAINKIINKRAERIRIIHNSDILLRTQLIYGRKLAGRTANFFRKVKTE